MTTKLCFRNNYHFRLRRRLNIVRSPVLNFNRCFSDSSRQLLIHQSWNCNFVKNVGRTKRNFTHVRICCLLTYLVGCSHDFVPGHRPFILSSSILPVPFSKVFRLCHFLLRVFTFSFLLSLYELQHFVTTFVSSFSEQEVKQVRQA